jgi:hypothetical protein
LELFCALCNEMKYVAHEAVDVACYAMMILDRALGITGEHRGRKV